MIADCDPNSVGPSKTTPIEVMKRLDALERALADLSSAWIAASCEADSSRDITAVPLRKMEGPLAVISCHVQDAIDQAYRKKGGQS